MQIHPVAYGAALHLPVVRVQAQPGRTREMQAELARVTARAVGRAFGIAPEGVWIHFEELRPQDIWFGGGFSAPAQKEGAQSR